MLSLSAILEALYTLNKLYKEFESILYRALKLLLYSSTSTTVQALFVNDCFMVQNWPSIASKQATVHSVQVQ